MLESLQSGERYERDPNMQPGRRVAQVPPQMLPHPEGPSIQMRVGGPNVGPLYEASYRFGSMQGAPDFVETPKYRDI